MEGGLRGQQPLPGLEHLDGDPCVHNSPGLPPACSGCSGSEHTRSCLLSMQLSLQMAPFSTLWTSWNIAVETHVLPVVGVTAFSSQDSMAAVCCGGEPSWVSVSLNPRLS